MADFNRIIQVARGQLSSAFTLGGDLPYSDGGTARRIPREAEATLAMESDLVMPRGNEDIGDFEEATGELGFEAIAFYVSFHRPTPRGEWGIFYFDHRMRQFAEMVRRALSVPPGVASKIALDTVRTHERFHFQFDVYALYHELILRRPLYNPYSESVYRHVVCTSDCFEEALANRGCLDLRFIPRYYVSIVAPVAKHLVRSFLRNFFAKAPPGYRDYGRPLRELQSGLGGQLFETKPNGRLPEPQSHWVSPARPYWKQDCPEYFLENRPNQAGKSPQFRFKRGGYLWDVHMNDADSWPSSPHGHDYNENVKLNIEDGAVYDVSSRKKVDRIKEKDLVELRKEIMRRWPEKPLTPLAA